MGYTYYNPLNVWLDPASIADVVAHIQAYLVEYPLINQSDIEQIVVDYITAHPELVGGVDSVNGETGEVILTASDINTIGTTTIQEVLTSLSSQISGIVQTVTNEATARTNADTALDNRINALQGAVGSPLVAATAAAMTDTSKIYVYTGSETGYTNGNWYYYNGSAWVSGGVYNAVAINTDTTLTVAGMAADAKATGDQLNDLKSSVDQLDDDFVEHEQYLLLSEWIANSRYSANSTNYGADTNYRRYAPLELKAGKYYYYAIHPYFTNLKFEDGTVTNLTSYAGTTQTVNNRDGYFDLNESATIYISTNQMSNSMLSLFEQNPNVYVEGVYYRKLKENVMPFTLNDLNASDVQIENVLLSVLEDVPTSNLCIYSNGKLIQSSPSSGNAGWRLPVDVSKVKNNLIMLDFDIESVTGTGRLYCIGKTTAGADKYITQSDITTAGKQQYVFDLNSFVVYNDLDLSKPVALAVYNQTNDFACTYTVIDSYSIITELDPEKNLNDNLNSMYVDIKYAKNSVNSIINSKRLIAPDGTAYFLQVSNNGELHVVEAVPSKSVFIGNSLLLGNGTFGICATDNENDYYYHTTSAISAANQSATFSRQHGSSFEVAETLTAATTWINTYVAPLMGDDVGLVVIQLGDNVNNTTRVNVFKDSCVALLRYVRENSPNANVIWVGEWYSTSEKQSIIADACAKTGSTFVDISDLYNTANMGHLGDVIHKTTETTTTYTVDSYTDDAVNHVLSVVFTVSSTQYRADLPYTSYTASGTTLTVTSYYTLVNSTGISSHPGNTGMLKIAERICNAIGL